MNAKDRGIAEAAAMAEFAKDETKTCLKQLLAISTTDPLRVDKSYSIILFSLVNMAQRIVDGYKKVLCLLVCVLALTSCNSRLLHPHETNQSGDQAVIADHLSGTITTEFQTIDIRTMDTSKPFTVKINGVLLNQYEYKFLNDNRAIVWIRRKADIEGTTIHFYSTSAALPGDSYLIETVLP